MDFQQPNGLAGAAEHYVLKSYASKLSQRANLGIWEFNIADDQEIKEWNTVNIAELLGYPASQQFEFGHFLTKLVHEEDQRKTARFFNDEAQNLPHAQIEVRLLTKTSGYRWFCLSGSAEWDENGKLIQLLGILFSVDVHKRTDLNLFKENQLLSSTAEMLRAGGWESNLLTGAVTWSAEIYHLLELPLHFRPDAENVKKYYHPDFYAALSDTLKLALETRSAFDFETCMLTARKRTVWVQLRGYVVCDDRGKCIAIKGSMQPLYNRAHTELLDANRQLTEQNKRLQNFAHIVSHNLRSYSNNLKTMVDMMYQPDMSEADIRECINHIKGVSTGLTNTVSHLTDVVKHQEDADRKRSVLSFQDTLDNITSALQNDLDRVNAKIITDFKIPEVSYLSAYLDSILLNMVTNAIKYSHPERNLLLRFGTYEQNGNIYLTIEDNGQGIDLNRHGNSLFGMYKTFHHHPDSRGLGLFMTRNQIEALGGSIEVDSTPGIGTKFTIKLV